MQLSLLQAEEMLGAVIAHQALGHCLAAGFDVPIETTGIFKTRFG